MGKPFKRSSDGKWCVKVNVGRTSTGATKRKTVYGNTKREAVEKANQVTASIVGGADLVADSPSLTVWLRQWQDMSRDNWKPKTVSENARYCEIITGVIGSVRLKDLKPTHVDELILSMKAAGRGVRAIQLCHGVLQSALNVAKSRDLLIRNVCQNVKPPTRRKKSYVTISADAIQQLIEAAREYRDGAVLTVSVTTGMRIGEVLGLQWSDVDFNAREITVQRTLSEVRGRSVLAEPKTEAGVRTISVGRVTVDALCDYRESLVSRGLAGCQFVFVNDAGNPLNQSNIRNRLWKSIKSELPGVIPARMTVHDLRHSHATQAMELGVSIGAVSNRLGHANIETTARVYLHSTKEADRAAADAFDAAVSPDD